MNGQPGPLNGSEELPVVDVPTTVPTVSSDMMYKISKKIAQLTKVIYSLNTRNDDLESDLETLRISFEEQQGKLRLASDTSGNEMMLNGDSTPPEVIPRSGKRRSKTPDTSSTSEETKKELKRAKHIMRHLETKMKAMEEDHKRQLEDQIKRAAAAGEGRDGDRLIAEKTLLEKQVRQINKEKQELIRRLDRFEVQNEHQRLEGCQLKKDLAGVTKENSNLQLQLSAARVQLKYNKETSVPPPPPSAVSAAATSRSQSVPTAQDDDFADELLAKIETLTKEKGTLAKALEDGRLLQEQQKKQLELARQKEQMSKFQSAPEKKSPEDTKLQQELLKARREKATLQTTLDETRKKHDSDVKSLKEDRRKVGAEMDALRATYDSEARRMKAACDKREEELRLIQAEMLRLTQETKASEERYRASIQDQASHMRLRESELEQANKDLASVQAQLSARSHDLSAAQRDRDDERRKAARDVGEVKERERKLLLEVSLLTDGKTRAEQRAHSAEKERDMLRVKLADTEAKMNLLSKNDKERASSDSNDKLAGLEKALEEALVERQEILEAAAKEIEHEKTIAIEREQAMMDDFEWKLREIESENRKKLKDLERSVDLKVRTATDDYVRKKDSDFTRMSISLRREMEEQMRKERVNLKQALDSQASSDRETAVNLARMEKDRQIRGLQKSWDEEKAKLEREKRSLQRRLDDLPNEVAKASRDIRTECDRIVFEERRKAAKVQERNQEEFDALRDELSGQITRVRAEYEERIDELNQQLENANTNRFSSMFQMKEEVEVEFTERMEQLRNMYKDEIEVLSKKIEDEAERAKTTEEKLREDILEKQEEIDGLNTYYAALEEEHEAKVNDLLTRLSEQTALAQKLQQEIDEYEWYSEGEEDEAGSKDRPNSSRGHHSRPPSTKPAPDSSGPTLNVVPAHPHPLQQQQQQPDSSVSEHSAVHLSVTECEQPNPPPRSGRAFDSSASAPPFPGAAAGATPAMGKANSNPAAEESPHSTRATETGDHEPDGLSMASSTASSSLWPERSASCPTASAKKKGPLAKMFSLQSSPKANRDNKRQVHSLGGSKEGSKKSNCAQQ